MNNNLIVHPVRQVNDNFKIINIKQLNYLLSDNPNANPNIYPIGTYISIQIGQRSHFPIYYYVYFDHNIGQITAFTIGKGISNISYFEIFLENTKRY